MGCRRWGVAGLRSELRLFGRLVWRCASAEEEGEEGEGLGEELGEGEHVYGCLNVGVG